MNVETNIRRKAQLSAGAGGSADEAMRGLLEGMHGISLTPEPPGDPDAVVEPPVEPVSKRGDVWTLGRHRLMCGDSTDADDVARLLDGATPWLMVTDPPYGVEYDPDWRNNSPGLDGQFGPHSKHHSRAGVVTNDNVAVRDGALELAPSVVAYVWSASLKILEAVRGLNAAGFELRTLLVWRKQHFAISRGHYHWQHELCWYGVRKGQPAKWIGGRRQSTIWDIQTSMGNIGPQVDFTDHSTVKPVECMERPIRNHEGDVYDPFVGSGTTIIAAERQGRACYAMEIEPRYVDTAIARWEQYTGGKAVCI